MALLPLAVRFDSRWAAGPYFLRIVCGGPSRGIFLAKHKNFGWSVVT
uniref:Uncharacterized protein n=1 Tax=Siphoviridae sp. ctrKX6 TaxID=2826476 RepID=A0A8S5NKA4_9CAUD|nr:MAG TPA: hypothetical protein [Siphoviridae sp. ctrKX6]